MQKDSKRQRKERVLPQTLPHFRDRLTDRGRLTVEEIEEIVSIVQEIPEGTYSVREFAALFGIKKSQCAVYIKRKPGETTEIAERGKAKLAAHFAALAVEREKYVSILRDIVEKDCTLEVREISQEMAHRGVKLGKSAIHNNLRRIGYVWERIVGRAGKWVLRDEQESIVVEY